MDEQTILEGLVSIQAVIDSGSRAVEAIYIQRGRRHRSRAVPRLLRSAQNRSIPVEYVGQETIESLADGQTHGGIIALVGPRRYVSLEDIVSDSDCPFVVMLDGIEDPFNFGAAIRALYAAGTDGLVVRPRNWMSAAGVVARSSAGASELSRSHRIGRPPASSGLPTSAGLDCGSCQGATSSPSRRVPSVHAPVYFQPEKARSRSSSA